jgi:transcriptional regulator with XRE-family HTH domain
MMTIADRIRNRRLELGLSVEELAERLQKDRATVYRYESNYIKSYSPEVMTSLADALQTTPDYFYYGYYDSDKEPPVIPVTPEAKILVKGIDSLPEEDRQQLLDMARLMFKHKFDQEDNHGTEL